MADASPSPRAADATGRERATSGFQARALAAIDRIAERPALLVAAAIVWLAALIWLRPLQIPDEGRYSDIARWMAFSGDWLVPRINGLPFQHKPPLYFWLEAAAIGVFGQSIVVDRLASLAGGALMCVSTFVLMRRMAGESAARWSLAALVFNPLVYAGAQFANLDMLVAGLVTATLCLAVLAARSEEKARGLWLAAYVAAALGVLAKGLIGAVLPGMVFVGWALAMRRPDWLWKAISPVGIAAFFAIATPWFILMERAQPGFNAYFFGYQHFARFARGGFNSDLGLWFYPAVLFAGMSPWSIAAAIGARSILATWRRDVVLLGLLWFGLVLIFFSIPRSKLIGYIFPLLPGFAILMGPWLATYRLRAATALIGAALCVAGVVGASILQARGPVKTAAMVKRQIAADDAVVFYYRYFFDVAAHLDRRTPILVVDDWSKTAAELPDSVKRQLTEGREFDPQAGRALISPADLKTMLGEKRTVWIWALKAVADADPELKALPVVASEGRFVLLRGGAK